MSQSGGFVLSAFALAAAFTVLPTACSERVEAPHVTCVDGTCSCDIGYADCNETLEDGCEVDTDADPKSCGACGRACPSDACDEASCRCLQGTDECDDDPSTVCETATDADPSNCGACGRDCLGGACASSQCLPVEIAIADNPEAIASNATHLFVLEKETIYRIPKVGGAREIIGSYARSAFYPAAAADERRLFVGTESGLFSLDLESLETESLSSASIVNVRLTASHVFIHVRRDALSEVWSAPRSTGEFVVLDDRGTPDLEQYGDTVYWIADDELRASTGDAYRGVFELPMSVHTFAVYGSEVVTCEKVDRRLTRFDASTGTATGTAEAPCDDIVMDDVGIVAAQTTLGDVLTVWDGETAPRVLDVGAADLLGYDRAVVVDAEAIYFMTPSAILRVRR